MIIIYRDGQVSHDGTIVTEQPIDIVGEGVPFERIRRITGYLVGDTSRFNDAKKAEEQDRVKHSFIEEVK